MFLSSACDLLLDGATAIFGPMSAVSGGHIQSMCDHLAIPHMEVRWDSQFHLESEHMATNLHPHFSTLAQAYSAFLRWNGWKKFTVLYDDAECEFQDDLTFYLGECIYIYRFRAIS